jgi:hypothetical protein
MLALIDFTQSAPPSVSRYSNPHPDSAPPPQHALMPHTQLHTAESMGLLYPTPACTLACFELHKEWLALDLRIFPGLGALSAGAYMVPLCRGGLRVACPLGLPQPGSQITPKDSKSKGVGQLKRELHPWHVGQTGPLVTYSQT